MVTLVIMDGFGIGRKGQGNAIRLAGTPYLDKLKKKYPNIKLSASGNAVGLPAGQMGNSEAGHLTLGAGRRIYQPLERINRAIVDGSFFQNSKLIKNINHAKKNNGAVHIIGLLSDGGVHSHIKHIKALIKLASDNQVKKIFLHIITDGRDVSPRSALKYIKEITDYCKKYNCEIKSVSGRAFAMDREKNWDRTKKAYNAIVLGKSKKTFYVAENVVEESYETEVYDEFIEPTCIGERVEIGEHDSVIFANFRKDRMRQLVNAMSCEKFDKFETKKIKDICFIGLAQYDETFKKVHVAFPTENIKNGLAEELSKQKVRQFHIAETTKYAHVTFYFNGGKEKPFKYEDRQIIETIQDLDFSAHPKMRAFEITTTTLDAIASGKYGFILVNFSNCDMVGHTANISATKTAVKVVDKCVYAIAMATLIAGGNCIITADHGNAEELLDSKGKPKTSHTTNPVPFILVSNIKYKLFSKGELSNVAPTVLDLLDLKAPKEMTNSLIKYF